MSERVKKLNNYLNSFTSYPSDKDECYGLFLYLKSFKDVYESLYDDKYTQVVHLAAELAHLSGNKDQAIAYLEEEYPKYDKICEYQYLGKCGILFLWASMLAELGRLPESFEKTRKATLYNLIDNTIYKDFEFLSFRPCSKYVFSEIADETLSLMHPSEFNDPMDTVLIKWLEYQKEHGATDIDRVMAENNLKAAQNIRVRCFSRTAPLPYKNGEDEIMRLRKHKTQDIRKIDPLMWAHYADNHKGVCIRYRFKDTDFELVNSAETEIFRFGNIKYQKNFSIIPPEIYISDALFAKSKVWKKENETRLVFYSTEDNVPKVKKVSIPGAIIGIYCGMRCSDEDIRIIKSLTQGRNIPIYKMYTKDSNVYKLLYKGV